jgi:hypothetical protein
MITGEGKTPIEVEAYLVATTHGPDGLSAWGGRVTPVNGEPLLPFLRAEALEIRVGGRRARIIFSWVGDSASEIEGLGRAPFE